MLDDQKLFIVIGLPRSGTSCMAGILHSIGYYMGPEEQLHQPNEFNSKGYFENQHIVNANNIMCNAMWGGWFTPEIFSEARFIDTNMANFGLGVSTSAINNLILREGNLFNAIKDPRIGLLIPAYIDCLDWINPYYIIMKRDQESNLKSMHRLYSYLFGYDLHFLEAFQDKYTSLLNHYFDEYALQYEEIWFEELLEAPFEIIKKMMIKFDIWPEHIKDEYEETINKFVDKGLKHY